MAWEDLTTKRRQLSDAGLQAFEPEPETVADDDVDFPKAQWL